MAANIDSMVYVGETPWHGLGHKYDTVPATPQEIILAAKMNWEVDDMRMKTDLHDRVLNYHAIYRKDNNDVLGVVNKAQIVHTQNIDTFNAFTDIIGKEVSVETSASLDRGCTIFGCFKINSGYKVLDDDVDHYFVVVNDHLKCDGKVTILNTPVRVVCQNTLNAALDNNSAKIRIPITADANVNAELARKIIGSAGTAIDKLGKKAEDMVKQKISKDYIDKLLDEMFPYIEVKDGEMSTHDKANERVEMMRDTFVSDCLDADNLGNYRGTQYQVFQGIIDFAQHYYLNADKSYDLKYRMGTVLGSTDSTQPIGLTQKFLKIQKKLMAA